MDKDLDEVMVDYAEMSGFDFSLIKEVEIKDNVIHLDYTNQLYTFKYGNYDMLDVLYSMA